MTPDAAPRTAAGRGLLEVLLLQDRVTGMAARPVDWGHVILAIEAEAAAGTALDVSTLAKAIDNFITSNTGFDVDDAEAIVAEYARLAAASEPGGEG